ncbi:MAG: hypothetical protein LQ343_001400 [Gyalolechia ehrenbergii]|nr:MAG: hypothetical protein LQ343_001400 [Gyalolechia ehrenbergii]
MSSRTRSLRSNPSAHSIDSDGTSASTSTRPSIHYEAPPDFRKAKLLPYELYVPALNLLISLLTLGTTSDPPRPAFLPPSQQLALAATVAIHPSFTTRALSEDRLQASVLALRYLRLVLSLVGPINGTLQEAFAFPTVGITSRRGAARRRITGDHASPTKNDLDSINSELANAGSVWAKAHDFWHVGGWAFNCSVLHKRRWERWQPWLEYMIDVLDKDWTLRAHMHTEDEDSEEDPRESSIIVRYLSAGDTIARQERRILRAIFADGSSRSTAEFPEIWRNETKERKKDADIKKSESKLDIEADNWGDYMQNEASSSSGLESTPPPASLTKSTSADSTTSIPDVSAPLGGPQSVILRFRLLSLLSTVSVFLPDNFTPLATLYDLFLEHIRPLPLPQFFLLVSPSSMQHLHLSAASSITQIILRSLIASSAPLPPTDDLTQDTLERCYLRYPANTGSISDNAKVSLCVETLLRLLQKHCGLDWNQDFQESVEKGIEAREQKAKKVGKGKAKGNGESTDERIWLRGSAGRIQRLVELIRDQQGETEV